MISLFTEGGHYVLGGHYSLVKIVHWDKFWEDNIQTPSQLATVKLSFYFIRKLGKLREPHITDWSLAIAKAFILLGNFGPYSFYFVMKLGKLREPHITDWSLAIAKAFISLGSLEN